MTSGLVGSEQPELLGAGDGSDLVCLDRCVSRQHLAHGTAGSELAGVHADGAAGRTALTIRAINDAVAAAESGPRKPLVQRPRRLPVENREQLAFKPAGQGRGGV